MNTDNSPGKFSRHVPKGDTLERDVCDTCGFVNYVNPKVVVGAVVVNVDSRILLCRRAIEPRSGFWTLPAGYLEANEAPDEGASREAREEANAEIDIECLLAIYAITRISQVQLIYRAHLTDPNVSPGIESEEVALFSWNEIPWADIAFPSVHWALGHYRQSRGQTGFAPFNAPQQVADQAAPAGI